MALPKLPKSKKYHPQGLEILHEDRDVIVINKHEGLLSTETLKGESKTAEMVLTNYVRKGCVASNKRAYLVHRLDRDTSGVMIFAKSEQACLRLQETWPETNKYYAAVVVGHLKEKKGLFQGYLAENEDQYVFTVLDPEKGKLSKTEYSVVKETPEYSLVKVHLLTGRKNQIRVHFAEAGHAVLGDRKYNGADRFRERLCLHSKSISFPHPHTGKLCFFETPLPELFSTLVGGVTEEEWNQA